MKTVLNTLDRIQACIKASEDYIDCRSIAAITGLEVRVVQKNIYDVRLRNAAEWKQEKIGGRMHYFIGERKAKRTHAFTLPDDLWRGWRDPVTGYQPDRLGV